MVEMIAMPRRGEVTQEQIDRCERTIGSDGRAFYQVKSESLDDTTYNVKWNVKYQRLTCDCKGGQEGYSCKHMRWSLAAEMEYKRFKRAEREAAKQQAEELERTQAVQREQAEQALAQADRQLRDLERAASKREQSALKKYGAKAYQPTPFSLLK